MIRRHKTGSTVADSTSDENGKDCDLLLCSRNASAHSVESGGADVADGGADADATSKQRRHNPGKKRRIRRRHDDQQRQRRLHHYQKQCQLLIKSKAFQGLTLIVCITVTGLFLLPTIVIYDLSSSSSSSSSSSATSTDGTDSSSRSLVGQQNPHQIRRRKPRLFVCTSGFTIFSHWDRVFPDYELIERLPSSLIAEPTTTMQKQQQQSKKRILSSKMNSSLTLNAGSADHFDNDDTYNDEPIRHDDILILQMYQRTCGHSPFRPTDLVGKFKGKILWFRAEPKYWTLETSFPRHQERAANQFQMGTFAVDMLSSASSTTAATTSNVSETSDGRSSLLRGNNKADEQLSQLQATTLSPAQDFWRRHTLQVHYLTLVVLEQIYDDTDNKWNWFYDPEKRRRSTLQAGPTSVAYFARNCVEFRQQTALTLSQDLNLSIHYASGGCTVDGRNNVEVKDKPRSNYTNNYDVFHDFKYCLVMENTVMDGYVTEKILNAFLGGCIPIYYGTSQIFDIFNRHAFIFWDIDNPNDAMTTIRQIKDDDEMYQQMLSEPILNDGQRTIDKYFSLYPTIENGSLNQQVRQLLRLSPLN